MQQLRQHENNRGYARLSSRHTSLKLHHKHHKPGWRIVHSLAPYSLLYQGAGRKSTFTAWDFVDQLEPAERAAAHGLLRVGTNVMTCEFAPAIRDRVFVTTFAEVLRSVTAVYVARHNARQCALLLLLRSGVCAACLCRRSTMRACLPLSCSTLRAPKLTCLGVPAGWSAMRCARSLALLS